MSWDGEERETALLSWAYVVTATGPSTSQPGNPASCSGHAHMDNGRAPVGTGRGLSGWVCAAQIEF